MDDHILSVNPANGDLVGAFKISTGEDVDKAVEAARAAYPSWSAMPAPKRGEILFKVAKILEERKEELGHLVTREMGKVISEGLSDVQEAIDMAYYMAGEGRRLQGETIPSELGDKDAKTVRESIGTFAIITPWNFPVAIPSWKLFACLIAGNTAVIKPSSDAPQCAYEFVRILHEAGVPEDVVKIVFGPGYGVGTRLTSNYVDGISFTGSCKVGSGVEKVAAAFRMPISTEMGGKNAVIIMDDADLDLAAQGCVWGGFGTSGQRCTAASRIVVHHKVFNDFLFKFTDLVKKLTVGDPFTCDVGPVINKAAEEKIKEYIVDGATRYNYIQNNNAVGDLSKGSFVMPTVFIDVDPTDRLAQEEIFGPVVCLIAAAHLDEAIDIVNDTKYGLSSAVFTNNIRNSALCERKLKTGIVYINAATIGAEIQFPFGGIKATGMGPREAGGRGGALDFYTNWKVIYRDYSGKLQKAQVEEE
jgi:aldehyde dehydrogenase (NAD+)